MSRPAICVDRVTGPEWLRIVKRLVNQHHRHHAASLGWLWGLVARRGSKIVGVAMCGRPVNRVLAGRGDIEVTRCCVLPGGARWGVASALYRAAQAHGATMTYTLASEPGTSLDAAGWFRDARVKGRAWKRPGKAIQVKMGFEKRPITEDKIRWRCVVVPQVMLNV